MRPSRRSTPGSAVPQPVEWRAIFFRDSLAQLASQLQRDVAGALEEPFTYVVLLLGELRPFWISVATSTRFPAFPTIP
jgi:hypothetical protein